MRYEGTRVATPTFLLEGRYGAVGTQPVEELRRVAERALAG